MYADVRQGQKGKRLTDGTTLMGLHLLRQWLDLQVQSAWLLYHWIDQDFDTSESSALLLCIIGVWGRREL